MIADHDGASSVTSSCLNCERRDTEDCCALGSGTLSTAQVQVYVRPCSINEFLAPKNLDECIPCEPDNYNLDVSAVRRTAFMSRSFHAFVLSSSLLRSSTACISICALS